ncbi:MAG: sugar phosphate isomerase/epimerase [Clostridia bacterium]|nr:sugar phosphate isomerase/epimerase [Clostridia bacterium]
MSKISLQMYTMREHTGSLASLETTVERLAGIGFEMLQYSVPENYDAAEVKRIFDRFGIKNDSLYCDSLALEEKSGKVLSQCELFDTKYVRLDSIPIGLTSSAAGYKMYAHYLNNVAAEYKKHDVKLLYHFHAFEFIRFGNTTGIEIFLAESDPEAIQIIPDTHWIHSGGRNICRFLETYKDRYDYVHFKDFGIATREETLEARPILYAPVGEGNLEWDDIIAVCKKNGVKSYAIEQDKCNGRNAFDCVTSSFNFMKKAGI